MGIVVGYASTTEGRAALERAGREALERGTDLLVVDTTRPDADGGPSEGGGVRADLDALDERLGGAGPLHRVVARGPSHEPAEEILAVAAHEGCELIVIGLRRRAPVGRLLLGANAQRILLEAPCPVLAVKGQP